LFILFLFNFDASVSELITYGLICQPITGFLIYSGVFCALSSDCV